MCNWNEFHQFSDTVPPASSCQINVQTFTNHKEYKCPYTSLIPDQTHSHDHCISK